MNSPLQHRRSSTDVTTACPCCAQTIYRDATFIWNFDERVLTGRGRAVQFTPLRARYFNELWKGWIVGSSPTASELLEIIYGNDPESRSVKTVVAHISFVRAIIEPFGLSIDGTIWGYRLFDRARASLGER